MSYVFCTPMKIDQLDALKIEHPTFKATLLLQGAQLIEFSPNASKNSLVWLSDSAEFKTGQPIRGGIPICWPWFGDLNKNPEQVQQQVDAVNAYPAHGFVRNMDWSIKSIDENCQSVSVTLEIFSNEETLKIWPFEFNLCACFTFSNELTMELITTNLSEKTMHFCQALHTYLPTQDIHSTYIHNANRALYIDALDNWKEKEQSGKICFNKETDRLYFLKAKDNGYELRVETPEQHLILNNKNTVSAVIWNPWIDKSLRLSQFDPNDYKKMFCIETASVLDDAKTLASLESDCITLVLKTL